MERCVRDGRVAVLVSPGFGAGWFSWHGIEALLFDPAVVELVKSGAEASVIERYCEDQYGSDPYFGGAEDLIVQWVPVGSRFRIHEYDGSESLVLESEEKWFVA
jgi:hypothetical protein